MCSACEILLFERKPRQREAGQTALPGTERERPDLQRLEARLAQTIEILYRQSGRIALHLPADLNLEPTPTAVRRVLDRLTWLGDLADPDAIYARLGSLEAPEARKTAREMREDLERHLLALQRQGYADLDAELLDNLRHLPGVPISQQQAAEAAAQQIEAKPLEGLTDVEVLDYITAASTGMNDEIATDYRRRIANAVANGVRAGLTDEDIAKGLIDLLAADPRARSQAFAIARTETTRFYTIGRVQAGNDAGDYIWGWRYEVIEDDRTTPICLNFAGHTVAKELLRQLPPFHWNCRTGVWVVMAAYVGGPAHPRTTLPTEVKPAEDFGGVPLVLRRAA